MRIALFSDVHGNLTALEAALSDIGGQQADQLVCLGDVAAFGPQPREVIKRLQALACHFVMGNTDAWLLSPSGQPNTDAESQRVHEIELWAAEQLTAGETEFLASFLPTVAVQSGHHRLLCFHGSPNDNHDVILATTSEEKLSALLGDARATVMAGGHTHVQLLRRFEDIVLVNPGSVGLPQERLPNSGRFRNPPWAEYAIIDFQGQALGVSFRRVPYDFRELAEAAHSSGMPHVEWWLGDWG